MRTDDFEKMMAGAEDALAYAEGDKSLGIAHFDPTVDIAAPRDKPDPSQTQTTETSASDKSTKHKIS